jgi:hypothetical protein
MVGNFAAIKAAARQAVHNQAAVQAYYTDSQVTSPVSLSCRWHNKLVAEVGNLESTGYAQTLEGVDAVVFDIGELTAAGLALRQGGFVTFPDYSMTFILDTLMPGDGVVNVKWMVTRGSP